MAKEKCTEIVKIRIAPSLKKSLQEQAQLLGLSLSDFIRAMLCGENHMLCKPSAKRMKADPKLLAAIARCGNNINQIARRINGGNLEFDILLELREIKEELSRYVD